MLKLTREQLDWLIERVPDSPRSPEGGRPVSDKRKIIRGIFWMLDNVAKWKDLPRQFGSKSTVHRWFQKWTREGLFEKLMRDAGRCVEEGHGYRVYECFIDVTLSKARGGGDGIGCTKVGKGVKIMVIVDARGLPMSVTTSSAQPHESQLVQAMFDFMLCDEDPERLIGDMAYDSDPLADKLAKQGIELIAPHRSNRRPENKTQDGRPLRRYKRRWIVERTSAGSRTTAACASGGRNRQVSSAASFIWPAPAFYSIRFWIGSSCASSHASYSCGEIVKPMKSASG